VCLDEEEAKEEGKSSGAATVTKKRRERRGRGGEVVFDVTTLTLQGRFAVTLPSQGGKKKKGKKEGKSPPINGRGGKKVKGREGLASYL